MADPRPECVDNGLSACGRLENRDHTRRVTPREATRTPTPTPTQCQNQPVALRLIHAHQPSAAGVGVVPGVVTGGVTTGGTDGGGAGLAAMVIASGCDVDRLDALSVAMTVAA